MSLSVSKLSLSLEGQVAIVTGGGTGIGQGIALEFAKAGADVVVSSRRVATIEEVAKEIRALGRRSLAVPTDVTKKADVDDLVKRTIDEFGVVDILVNNAAHSGHAPGLDHDLSILEDEEEQWDLVIDTNLTSVYLGCRVVAKLMMERKKGNIINISSRNAFQGPAFADTYAISKAAVVRLTRGLACQLGSYNIRVNSIAPGAIQTHMVKRLWQDAKVLENFETTVPLRRIGQPPDIGTVAVFLASEASNHITGQTIIVDGGVSAV